MIRFSLASVIFVVACSGARRDDRTPTVVPSQQAAPVAEPSAPGDAGIVSPPPEPDTEKLDVPHGSVQAHDPTLFAQLPPADAGVRIAPQDGGFDGGAPGPDAARPGDAGVSPDAPRGGPRDAGRDAR